jgi:hypothetical protein
MTKCVDCICDLELDDLQNPSKYTCPICKKDYDLNFDVLVYLLNQNKELKKRLDLIDG